MSSHADRLAALREQLKSDQLDGFVVPLTDEHMSEYVGTYAQRLAWLTGFEGSAGSAVVLPEEAAIFTDGRYTLQVRSQVDGKLGPTIGAGTSIADWAEGAWPRAGVSATIPWLHSRDWGDPASEALEAKGAKLVPVRRNPSTRLDDRPEASTERLVVHGTGWRAKRRPKSAMKLPTGWSSSPPMPRCWRRSIPSPGPSTSVVVTSAARRSRWLMPSSTPTAPPISMSPARRSTATFASTSAMACASMNAPTLKRR